MAGVFVGTDVILDLLVQRVPFYDDASQLFSSADREEVRLVVSSLCFTNIHYILSKTFTAAKSHQMLIRFKTLVSVAPVTDKCIELALASVFTDFEDAVQYYTAIEADASVIVTRNIKDYKRSEIPVMTAGDFLKG
jgi:predicted nucleic acid-binding protein